MSKLRRKTNKECSIVKRFTPALFLIILIGFSPISLAGDNRWYQGKVYSIRLTGDSEGSFFVRLKDNVFAHCKHNRVYFLHERLGEGRLKAAYSMAIAAGAAGRDFGIVTLKKELLPDGANCYADGQTAGLIF